jgi:transposase
MIKVLENMTKNELVNEIISRNRFWGAKEKELVSEKHHLKLQTIHLEEQIVLKEEQAKILESENNYLAAYNKQLEGKVDNLQFQIDQLRRMMFEAKRERFIATEIDEHQLKLPFEVAEKPVEEPQEEQISYSRKKQTRKNHPGRMPLPDHLPVEEIILEPEEDTISILMSGSKMCWKESKTPNPANCTSCCHKTGRRISTQNPQNKQN